MGRSLVGLEMGFLIFDGPIWFAKSNNHLFLGVKKLLFFIKKEFVVSVRQYDVLFGFVVQWLRFSELFNSKILVSLRFVSNLSHSLRSRVL